MKNLTLFCFCLLCISKFSFAEKVRVLDSNGKSIGMCDKGVCAGLCCGYSCSQRGSKPTKKEYIESLKGFTVKRIKGEIQFYNGKDMFARFKATDANGISYEKDINFAKSNQPNKIKSD
ncbi:MAG: hypothetical protein KA319_14280 [Ferruginibacter sp.]|nr:hypothetical protein [Ferruginibacter sp.]